MDALPEFSEPEDGYPLIPYPSSTFNAPLGASSAYESHTISIHSGRERSVVTVHQLNAATACFKLSQITPQLNTSAIIRNSKEPNNICIESMTLKIVNCVQPEKNNKLMSVTMFTTEASPKTTMEIKEHAKSATGHIYKIPRLALAKFAASPLLGFSEPAGGDEKLGRFLTIDEVSRAIMRNTYPEMCSGHIYLNHPHTKELTLIPASDCKIPVAFCIGLDNARLFDEYTKLRLPNTQRDIPSDCTVVPLFRRVKSPGSYETYAPTLFGFWLRYFMDVYNNRRAHVLPKKVHEYVPLIDSCHMLPIDETHTLTAMAIVAPRSLITGLYDGLLADLADDASARLYHVQKTNVILLFGGSAMDELEKRESDAKTDKDKFCVFVELTTVYRQITVTNSTTRAQIPFDANADVIHREDVMTESW